MTHAETLLAFCEAIGIEAAEVKQAETLRRYHLSTDKPAGSLKRITAAALDMLVQAFGAGLTVTVGIPDTLPLLEIKAGQVPNLEKALEHIEEHDDPFELRLDLVLDKDSLLAQLDLEDDQYHSLFYLFRENLVRFLRSPLPELDHTLFADRYQPTIVVVSDAEMRYVGQFLIVTGVDDLGPSRRCLMSTSRKFHELVTKYYGTAIDRLNWTGFQLEHITPMHFICSRIGGDAGELDAILADHSLHLFILYTANRSSYDSGQFRASFASSERVAELKLVAGDGSSKMQSLPPDLACWPYEGTETDRLTIFQNVVARELESDDPEENYRAFRSRLRRLIDEACWHHRVLLDGQIDKHFELIQTVTQYVVDVAKEVSGKLDSVTKGLTDSLLATVGVIVLTFLASLVKNETQGIIFGIGMWSYAVYLLLFQGFYRLGSIWHSYDLLQKETDERLEVYAAKLGRKRVDELLSPLASRKHQFLVWFWLTVGIYLTVIVLIVILGFFLPSYLKQTGAASLPATPTPLPTPTPIPTPTSIPTPTLALACLGAKERHILYPRWSGIEAGATLSDEFRIMWEPIGPESRDRQLVHRCFVDSENSRDHGCVTRALDHSEGSIAFIEDYLGGDLEDAYSEDEFLENLGMFLGIASHHICDLCTPVHVGHDMDYAKVDSRSRRGFHSRVERDIARLDHRALVRLTKPKIVDLSEEYYWSIAQSTYSDLFLPLESLYPARDESLMVNMASEVISRGVQHTADVWHTVLSTTNMAERKWSLQPLL